MSSLSKVSNSWFVPRHAIIIAYVSTGSTPFLKFFRIISERFRTGFSLVFPSFRTFPNTFRTNPNGSELYGFRVKPVGFRLGFLPPIFRSQGVGFPCLIKVF
jgi:hypothetical protein